MEELRHLRKAEAGFRKLECNFGHFYDTFYCRFPILDALKLALKHLHRDSHYLTRCSPVLQDTSNLFSMETNSRIILILETLE